MGLENLFGLPFFSHYTPIQLFCELSGQQFISLTNTPPRCTDGLTLLISQVTEPSESVYNRLSFIQLNRVLKSTYLHTFITVAKLFMIPKRVGLYTTMDSIGR